jgi:hypothetical protein
MVWLAQPRMPRVPEGVLILTSPLPCEAESAARCLNRHAAGAFVRIIHKLVEPDLRRGSNTKVALVIKLQAAWPELPVLIVSLA